jgi:hypothetical protein
LIAHKAELGGRGRGDLSDDGATVGSDETLLVPPQAGGLDAATAFGVVDLETNGGNMLTSGTSSLAGIGNAVEVRLADNASVVHVAQGRGCLA